MIVFWAAAVKGFRLKNKPLVLASGSAYRRQLLSRLGLAFEAVAPDIDEAPLAGEAPRATAVRLARLKAQALSTRFPTARIIGSDQVAVLDGEPVGKPGNHANAVAQLRAASGMEMVFHTALCLLDAETGKVQETVAENFVKFRTLADDEIERYLRREQPYDCAGSAKSEGLGIALLEWNRGDDPNALIGLPLIALVSMLRAAGVFVP